MSGTVERMDSGSGSQQLSAAPTPAPVAPPGPKPVPARRRILDASYALFARRGIRDVGVDELIENAGVARATFYSHFRSKDDLVLAYLARLFEARSAAIETAVRGGGEGPSALLGIFDVFAQVFKPGVNDGSSFVHVLIEMGAEHPLGKASIDYLAQTRTQIAALASEAGLRDTQEFATKCHLLIKGAVVSAAEGDWDAVEHARSMAGPLIEQYRISPPQL
jgi:AcrR family transcriptional regulator